MSNSPDYITGSFDRCLECIYLGNGCGGPRTTSMSFERWLFWIKALKQKRGLSNADCAEGAKLSKGTVDNIFAGKHKDVSRFTAGALENFLIGDNSSWPCAMDIKHDEVVYIDRAETIEALAQKTQELEAVRQEEKQKVDFLLAQITQKDRIIKRLLEDK